ncbi:hypothetical protein JYU34_009161, partial [Plutella xylostella]
MRTYSGFSRAANTLCVSTRSPPCIPLVDDGFFGKVQELRRSLVERAGVRQAAAAARGRRYKHAQAQHVWQRVEVGADKLLTAYSTIAFVVQKHHFQDNRLKLR